MGTAHRNHPREKEKCPRHAAWQLLVNRMLVKSAPPAGTRARREFFRCGYRHGGAVWGALLAPA
jgi:hypothetical protein